MRYVSGMKLSPARIAFILLFGFGFIGALSSNFDSYGFFYFLTLPGLINCIIVPAIPAGLLAFVVSRYKTGKKPKN
jgi:hypothetical protein